MPENRDIREEQQFLDAAYDALDSMRDDARRLLESVLDLGRGGTFQSRTERDIVVRTSLARLAQLDIGDQALTFGRIDRAPDGDDAESESFHIGRLAVWGPDHEPLIVDWRAPVAAPFYRATGLDPQGLVRRRHLAVTGRTVTGVEDEYFAAPGAGAGAAGTDTAGTDTAGTDTAGTGANGTGANGTGANGNGLTGSRDGDASRDATSTSPEPREERLTGEGVHLGGPGALLAALGRARTGRMADIISTIQREQDEIIRSPMAGVLVVQGGPGTGKTAIALHRAAYLLYTYRFPLERQGVLVVGPNPLFLRYIERVLPSLGETGVTLSTVSGLVPEVRVRGEDAPDVARLKGDARMAAVIARAVRSRQRPLPRPLDVAFGSTTLRLERAESDAIVAAARRRAGTHNARRRFVERQVLERLAHQAERARHRSTGGPRAGEPAVPGDRSDAELADLRRQIRRLPAVVEALDRMWPRLSPHELVHDLFGALPLLRAAGRGVLDGDEIAALHRPRSGNLDQVRWTPADAALVDEARALLGPRRARQRRRAEAREAEPNADATGFWPAGLRVSPLPAGDGMHPGDEDIRSFGHIVVDEAQDLSPMQRRLLARRSISGSMTVVGDLAQATGPWAPDSWTAVAAQLAPTREARQVELSVAYRTPAEVMEVAAGVLAVAAPGVRAPRPVRRSGQVPATRRASSELLIAVAADAAAAEVGAVTDAGEGTVAVLVPGTLLAAVTDALSVRGLDPVDPRQASGAGLSAPLVVLPATESHGLEFDAVVVVEPAGIAGGAGWRPGETEPPTTAGLRALYVALTRPTRRLVVVHAADLPEGMAPAAPGDVPAVAEGAPRHP